MTGQEISQTVKPLMYEDNNPFNKAFDYSYFLISAILMLIIQQVMLYSMSMLAGTKRERNISFATMTDRFEGRGVVRVLTGRGGAYWLIFLGIGLYVAFIVPALFGIPQRGSFGDVLTMLLFFITDCVFFSMTWSTFITRRESVFLIFLSMSPIALFLTGCSWPTCSFPWFWKMCSYLFPSTFGVQAFMNMSTAGGADDGNRHPDYCLLHHQLHRSLCREPADPPQAGPGGRVGKGVRASRPLAGIFADDVEDDLGGLLHRRDRQELHLAVEV